MEEKKLTGYPSIDKPWLKYYKEVAINYNLPRSSAYRYMTESNYGYENEFAINYYNHLITYKELDDNINSVAKSLVAYGIKKGDIITICSITIPEVIYLFYALNKIGAIANMIDPRINENRLAEIINSCNTDTIFCLDIIYEKLGNIIKTTNIKNCIFISAQTSLPVLLKLISSFNKKQGQSAISWNKFLESKIEKVNECSYTENYPAAIVYTGGTTGIPKGAILSNDCFNAMAESYRWCIPPYNKRQQKILNIMPPFIAYGLVNGIHMPISLGVINIIVPKFSPQQFAKLLKKYKPQHTLGVPSHYNVLINSQEMKGVDLSFWINPAVGGDSMNSILEQKLNDFLLEHNCQSRITKGYGMTELSGTGISSSFAFNKFESVGIPFSKNTVGIFKPNTDEELKYNEIGEICIKSPTMFLKYYNNEAEDLIVKKAHRDGSIWIHSQDYGYIDEDGFVFVKGRIKRTIVRPDGHNNYPMEMESILNSHSYVFNSAVVDIKATKYGNGELPFAFVVLNEKQDSLNAAKDLMNWCKEKLPQRDIPCYIHITSTLPLTNVGKIDYSTLHTEAEYLIESYSQVTDEIYRNYEDTLIIR